MPRWMSVCSVSVRDDCPFSFMLGAKMWVMCATPKYLKAYFFGFLRRRWFLLVDSHRFLGKCRWWHHSWLLEDWFLKGGPFKSGFLRSLESWFLRFLKCGLFWSLKSGFLWSLNCRFLRSFNCRFLRSFRGFHLLCSGRLTRTGRWRLGSQTNWQRSRLCWWFVLFHLMTNFHNWGFRKNAF